MKFIRASDLVPGYIDFLKTKDPKRVKSFQSLLSTQRSSAISEAVAFHFFGYYVDEIQVEEIPNKGGVDFRCRTGDTNFVVEVTHLDVEAVENRSGLPNDPTQDNAVGCFSSITKKLYDTADKKVHQMSGYECPGILVIACTHNLADLLFSTSAAEDLLVGDTKISIPIPKYLLTDATKEHTPIEDPRQNLSLRTDLENAIFFRWNDEWEACNRSISAVLLFHISGANAFVLGILHPDPVHKFPIQFLPSVPFVRLKKWPPEDEVMLTEWVKYEENTERVIRNPEHQSFWYADCKK